jgi:hypothetical protein
MSVLDKIDVGKLEAEIRKLRAEVAPTLSEIARLERVRAVIAGDSGRAPGVETQAARALAILQDGQPRHVEQLAAEMGIPRPQVTAVLSRLVFDGRAIRVRKGVYTVEAA